MAVHKVKVHFPPLCMLIGQILKTAFVISLISLFFFHALFSRSN